MNTPGPAGTLILLAFAIVFTIEFHTLLGMFGLKIGASIYFPVAAVLLTVIFLTLLVLPNESESQAVSA